MRLLQPDGITEVVGTVSYHPTDPTLMLFNVDIDTIPGNTLAPINAIINPTSSSLTTAITHPSAVNTRYLILGAIGSSNNPSGSGPVLWQGTDGQDLIANANDIIQWNGSHWFVSFDSQNDTALQYVSNLTTGTQYKWTLQQWVKSYEGEYKNGLWTLVI